MLFRIRQSGSEIELIPALSKEYEILKEIAKDGVCSVAFARKPYVRFLFTGDIAPVLKLLKLRGVTTMVPAK